jgi:hypothetical protein
VIQSDRREPDVSRRGSLELLPEPPRGKTGWPWTEGSRQLLDQTKGPREWPRLTIVTPSFNQGRFIEGAIRSILLQGYPNLEYFVFDGGSSDNTVVILERYSPWIDFWVSRPDRGQSEAINSGLRRGSGSHATWVNSDDMLCSDALVSHVSSHGLASDVIYVGDCVNIDADGAPLFTHRGRVRSLEDLLRVRSVWNAGGYVAQPEVLFPRQLAMSVGGVNEENHLSMDYELWGRLLLAGARVQYTGIRMGAFRRHPAQKSHQSVKLTESTLDAAERLLAHAAALPAAVRGDIHDELRGYRQEYKAIAWRHTGRLARLGLPPAVVTPLRAGRRFVSDALEACARIAK